jgi:hypothetical protein
VKVKLDIEGVADAAEFGTASEPGGPGGFVAKDGWKMITLSVDGAGSARLNWNSTNIVVYTATNGTALSNPTYWPDTSTMPSNLWVYGVDASASGPTATVCGSEHICLEALNNGTSYTTPYFDRVGFTVVAVTKIEYCRFDLSTWSTDITIAAGAKTSDVHNAKVRVTIAPVTAGVSIIPETNGASGIVTSGVLTPSGSQLTDANGQVNYSYRSGDRVTNLTIKVVECAGTSVNIDLGSTLHQAWDMAGAHDYKYPAYFEPGLSDKITFYPTLDVAGGAGAIDGHYIGYYTIKLDLLELSFNFSTGLSSSSPIIALFPLYSGLPTGFCISDFVVHSVTTEILPGEYENEQTVQDWWDYDLLTDTFTIYAVQGYTFGAYDANVAP